MIGGLIGFVACLMCAIPFFIISKYEKDSREPINFWSGDESLEKKVKNVKEYNREMAALYQKCAVAFLVAGLGCLFYMGLGILILGLECTVGIYLVYRKYKKILEQYM